MYQSFSRAIAALLIGAGGMGAAAAAELPYLDDVTVAAMSLAEKRALTAELSAFLKQADDGKRGRWSSEGRDGAAPVEAEFSVDNSSASDASTSATFCRDLTLLLRAGGKEQQLTRKTCASLSGKFDIEEKEPVKVFPPFLSDVTLVKLSDKERASLTAAAVAALRNSEDGKPASWSNKGLGKAVPLKAQLTVLLTRSVGILTCRDLSMVLEAKGAKQTLLRSVCENKYGKWDIAAGGNKED